MSKMDYMSFYYRLPSWGRSVALTGYGFWQARKRFDREFWTWYESLIKSQWLSASELRSQQMERLAILLNHVCEHVPYYKKAFCKAGVKPSDISSIDDLVKLPKLTRDSVASNLRELCSDNMPEYKPVFTRSSGSTGQKLQFYLPAELRWAVSAAILWRFYSWAGVKVGERRATLGARIFTVRPPYWAWNRWENQLLLSSHHLDSVNLHEYSRLLRKFKISFIQGHPSAIAVLAQHIVSEERPIPMKAVFTTGETVYDEDRAIIKQAFDCDLLDSYGMGECAAAAQECSEHHGYHELSEYCIIELIPADDGLFEVVGTSLLNFAMPFIRYRTGDLVEPIQMTTRCQCGRGLPLKFRKVIGRVDDRLVFPEKVILPVTVRMFMKPLLLPGENYQVVQEDLKTLNVVLTGPVSPTRADHIRTQLSIFMPRQVRINVVHGDEIRGSNNKIRNVVSRIRG